MRGRGFPGFRPAADGSCVFIWILWVGTRYLTWRMGSQLGYVVNNHGEFFEYISPLSRIGLDWTPSKWLINGGY